MFQSSRRLIRVGQAVRLPLGVLLGLLALGLGTTHMAWAAGKPPIVQLTDQLTFAPESVTIAPGETVVWKNTSVLVHTVTADPAKAGDPAHVRLPAGVEPFDSGKLKPGESFRRTFEVAGTYRYFCIPHEGAEMVGRVVVKPR